MPSRFANGNTPGDQPPTGRWAAVSPPSGSGLAHLLPCPSCGALNGRSALACWDCEASLLTDPPPWSNAATERAASRPAALTPPEADADTPVTEAVAQDDVRDLGPASDAQPLDPAPMPLPLRPSVDAYESRLDLPVLTMAVAPPRKRPRRRWLIASGVVVAMAAVLATVAALEFRRDAADVATRDAAALPWPPSPGVAAPAPAAATTPQPAAATTLSRGVPVTLDFDSQPAPAAGPTPPPPPRAVASRATRAAPAPAPDAAPPPPPAARPTARAPAPAPARLPARPPAYEAPAPPPPTVAGPCTANVAALGLCAPAAP